MPYNTPYQPEEPAPGDLCGCQQDGCEKTGYQYADISFPVELKPDADIGKITVECCGEPMVDCSERECASSSELIITQRVNIKIPVHFQVTACMGETYISCGNNDCCG